MEHLGDVSRVHGDEIDPVDIVTFGSPCQDMSIAGKRAGIKNENVGDEETTRSGLFHEAARIIKEMRESTNGLYPAFAVWENVPGAFSSNKGEDIRCVLETLVKIVEPGADVPTVPKSGWSYYDCWMGDGWSLAYRTFDAQYWGVPQRRRRIYLVLDLRGHRAGKILFERKGLRGYFETGRTPWEGTASNVTGSAGVCNKPVPYTMKIRSGCEGGGKGPLIQEDKSATLATNNDQYLFVPVVSAGFKPDQGAKARSVRWESALPFDTTQITSPQNGCNPEFGDPCHPLAATGHAPTVICLQGNMVDRNAKQNGSGISENVSFTINATDRHSVAFREVSFGEYRIDECSSTLTGRMSNNVKYLILIRYIVRRLTPTECARLQGFPDKWGHPDVKDDLTDDEHLFWKEVRNTYSFINGKQQKEYTKQQMLTWYNKLHTDSAEYKMWGNGIALPNALYVMQGIAEVMENDA